VKSCSQGEGGAHCWGDGPYKDKCLNPSCDETRIRVFVETNSGGTALKLRDQTGQTLAWFPVAFSSKHGHVTAAETLENARVVAALIEDGTLQFAFTPA